MTVSNRDDPAVVQAAAALAKRFEEQLPELTGSIQQLLISEIPELRGQAQLLQLLHDHIAGSVETFSTVVRNDIAIQNVTSPTAALEYARRLAQRGVSVAALMRSYRLGHRALLAGVADEIRTAGLEPGLALGIEERITAISFDYIDQVVEQAVAAYQDERDRWLEHQNSLRTSSLHQLLSDEDVGADADVLEAAIRYPLKHVHLALVMWYDKSDSESGIALMESFIRRAAESLGAQQSWLFLPLDQTTGWAWIALPPGVAPDAVSRLQVFVDSATAAPAVAIGNPLPGVDGFRRSHRQAQDAYTVATTPGSGARRVISAGDPGVALAALLGKNVAAAAEWVAEVLGPLSEATDSDNRLRETLRVFLRSGSSYTAAADELHLHYNSVKYRVQRAVERRGRPVEKDRSDVEVALILCHWFGSAVLS
ncbi:PucR family transcriptional regulator [[Mycobacterium] vasticus]|uniref:Helix-turn-helix domain-containing protein n=1 Tax=[Mycobacterium] vasticus TaxID=2875777 RepID=A0ABU5YU48_9MYCO|nr:helix-turn-helix domain-containing protein [Mycolicibacter sp. MYC017]MEB3068646.1 helix-turn-helix domain-containing protein [Mycolicibacter sp. MYC017]